MDLRFLMGPLTGPAIFDALMCKVEFVAAFPRPRDGLLTYGQHTMWPHARAGCYSDDVQMKLGVGEWMLSLTKDVTELPSFLVNAYVRDPRGGSPKMLDAIHRSVSPGVSLEECLGEKTEGSGATMRASLFGYASSEAEVIRLAGEQAELTHRGDGVLAAQAAALMVYLMKESCDPKDLGRLLAERLGDSRFVLKEKPKGRSNKGMDCVLMALWVLQAAETLSDIAYMILDHGADSDTIGVIAMSAAWFREDYKHDLPWNLWWDLEDGPYGRSYLRRVEMGLLDSGLLTQHGMPMRLRAV